METKDFMTKIKELRARKGYSQEELAERSGLSLRTIQRIENGETDPRGDSLRRLSEALGVSPDELVDWTVQEDRSYLVGVTMSALSFLVFPLLGIIIPLILWFTKKDKIENLNNAAKGILNFEITWNILLFAGYIIIIVFSFVNKIAVAASGDISPALVSGYVRNIFVWSAFAYVWNFIFIIANIIRIQRGKRLLYCPKFRFIR